MAQENYKISWILLKEFFFVSQGDEQPGYACCYSPFNLFMFGFACFSLDRSKLKSFVCTKASRFKDDRNIESCVSTFLDQLKSPTPLYIHQYLAAAAVSLYHRTIGFERNLMFDNCGGQSKNNDVLLVVLCLALLRSF